jgi:anti-sigma regulatory factor (Ser/Thr protein kinase)
MSLEEEFVASRDGSATAVPQLRLLVPPDPKEARAVRERVAAFTRTLGIDEEALADVVTTIGEAFANAIQHADTHDSIEVTAWLDDDGRLCARIVDRGRGFAPVPVTEAPYRAADAMAECGRGMWIMNSCSDSFSIESLPDVGTAIVFARRIREGSKAPNRNG